MLPVVLFALATAGAQAGSISGTILPPGRVKKVQAFERLGATATKIENRYHDGTIDPKTGKFEIPNLPDGTYQLLLDCGDASIEGVDLAIDDEEKGATFDYVFAARKLTTQRLDLSKSIDPDEAVSDDRRHELESKAVGLPKLMEKLESLKEMDRFCDHFRPLYAHGAGDKAFVLVELARLREFYSGKGQAIYRVEIWPFERAGEGWSQATKGTRVLQRHRLDKEAYGKLGVFFEPRLGGIRILKGKDVSGIEYTIPGRWNDTMGKAPGIK